MVEIGGGKSSLQTLCACLNMPRTMTDQTYNSMLKTVKDALKGKAKECTKNGALEESESGGVK